MLIQHNLCIQKFLTQIFRRLLNKNFPLSNNIHINKHNSQDYYQKNIAALQIQINFR